MNAVGDKPADDERSQRQQREKTENEEPASRVGGRAGLIQQHPEPQDQQVRERR